MALQDHKEPEGFRRIMPRPVHRGSTPSTRKLALPGSTGPSYMRGARVGANAAACRASTARLLPAVPPSVPAPPLLSATQPVSRVATLPVVVERPLRAPRREHGWRAAGFAVLAVAAWTPLVFGAPRAALAAAALVLLSVAVLEVAAHDL